jgi:hypothetical protein
MELQRLFHSDGQVTHAEVAAAKAELVRVRAGLQEAEAALAKVRAQIAALSAPKFITAEPLGLSSSELAAEMRKDHRFHLGKGWGGLAYEAMVADDGTIGFGNPMSRKSAAVDSTNTGMVSICCPGTTGDRMTDAQKRSVRWLLDNWHTAKVPKPHRLPKKARQFGWLGHHEYPGQSTACPGVMLSDFRKVWA